MKKTIFIISVGRYIGPMFQMWSGTMSLDISKQSVLITGAGRGLGAAIATAR